MSRSLELKEEGNRHFQAGDYVGAESLYSKAIIADSKNPALYTNRAMARLKLNLWDSVISDCEAVLSLPSGETNIKAHYYLSQAHLELFSPASALPHALRAHALCAASNDKSLAAVTAVVLRCKKEKWLQVDRLRRREDADLERNVMEMLQREADADIETAMDDEEKAAVAEEAAAKKKSMAAVFERAREAADRRREPPDWLIDDISFCVLVDPVMTKTGKSYERASITEHLRRHPSDPLTREPLTMAELRPNIALRQACEQFVDENGWVVDW